MPTISAFYGVTIRIFWAGHEPPHFHAVYAGSKAAIEIESLCVRRGFLPPRALAMTLEWAAMHRDELLEDWRLCVKNEMPNRIRPLD